MKSDPKTFLEESAKLYHNTILSDWEKLYHKKRDNLYNVLREYIVPPRILELGCADGIITEKLCKDFEKVTVVDGSQIFLDEVRDHVKARNLSTVLSLFEEYSPSERFNTIFMTHILEHMDKPLALLKRAKEWLIPGGRVLIDVPNAQSLHRLVGVKLGMLASTDALNEQDIILGHKRVYTPKLLKEHVRKAGYRILKFGGLMIKPLSNRQIEGQWSDELIDAFFALSDELPELCSEIYIVAEI